MLRMRNLVSNGDSTACHCESAEENNMLKQHEFFGAKREVAAAA